MTGFADALVHLLWPWLAGASLLGFATGAATNAAAPPGRHGRAIVRLAIGAVLVLVAVAILGIVPGRAGFRLEIALAFVLVWLAGSGLGSMARRLVRS